MRWATGYWFITLVGKAGAVHRKLSSMDKEDTLGGDAGVTLGEGAGFTKM